MKLKFDVQGSEPVPYEIVATKRGSNMTMTCDCMGAAMGRHCKHRVNLLCGDITHLVSNNAQDVEKLKEMVKGTDVEHALEAVLEAETAQRDAKRHHDGTKRALARALQD